jgi:hypothetical protein
VEEARKERKDPPNGTVGEKGKSLSRKIKKKS